MWHWQAKGSTVSTVHCKCACFFHHSIKNSRSNLYQKLKIQLLRFEKNSTGDQFHHFPLRGQKHLKWPCQALASDKLHFISLLFSKIKSTLHNVWNNIKYRLISIYHAFILVLPCTGGILFAINLVAPWGNHQAMKPGDWYCPAGLLNFLHLLKVHRTDHFKSTGKLSAVWAHRKKKQKNSPSLHWHNELHAAMLTSSWQTMSLSTNQQGAAGISCTHTILPSCWGVWWHAVCEESALPKASFTDKDFYKRSLPPQKKPEDIAS